MAFATAPKTSAASENDKKHQGQVVFHTNMDRTVGNSRPFLSQSCFGKWVSDLFSKLGMFENDVQLFLKSKPTF